ncbi:MAG TPA: tagatose 1,6-diphosphate aldolase [bacterium]|nr:tagatose 1,6-diphosphate aldolase [bacterium]
MMLSSGKLTNLMRLADASGRLKMLAVDQRDSMRAPLAAATRRRPEDITYDELAATKTLVAEVLSSHSTAILLDPIYGLPRGITAVGGSAALLVAVEDSPPALLGPSRERKMALIDGWSVAQAKRAGANAVKLLVYDTPEASAEVRAHHRDLVRRVGEECVLHDLPFLLEVVAYPIEEPGEDTPEFALKRPRHTIAAAREFSDPAYHVDLLKLPFPGDLKYTRQFRDAVFDPRERPAVYTLDDIRGFCRDLDAAAGRPWVILSGGVGIREFLANLDLAVDAGASGFLCGRAIWQDVLPLHPDRQAMRAFLASTASHNFDRANAVAERARPWFDHPHFGGWGQIRLQGGGADWYRRYGAPPPL